MKKERLSQVLFLAAATVAFLVHYLSAPSSLPWVVETRMAERLVAGGGDLTMTWRLWGHLVAMFAGDFVLLACVLAALTAGILAFVANRYFRWRVAVSAALLWTFLPWVWDGTALGSRGVCLASLLLLLLWWAHRLTLLAMRLEWVDEETVLASFGEKAVNGKLRRHAFFRRCASWSLLSVSGLFALVSVLAHDWWLGEPAGLYARGVVREAGDRIVVLNGVADEQVLEALRDKYRESLSPNAGSRTGKGILSSVSSAAGYRSAHFAAQVRAEWPEQTNYWVAAEIGPGVFLREVTKEYAANFYRMGGRSSTLEGWEKRWEEAKACLGSHDPFVPVMRRVFAYEGNCVANALQDQAEKGGGGGKGEAWRTYKRICTEIDPGNFAALVNQCEMMRRGYKVSEDERRSVNRKMEEFFSDPARRSRAREIVRAAGPVRSDPELVARLEKEARARVAEKVARGELSELPKAWTTLIEWSNEMITAVGRCEYTKATQIARAILSHEPWSGFIPANAILGTATAAQGDYVAAEVFFRRAMATTNAVPAVVLNDYAHTLMCLGRLDEAEGLARRAVASDKTLRVARRTLGEILVRRKAAERRREK